MRHGQSFFRLLFAMLIILLAACGKSEKPATQIAAVPPIEAVSAPPAVSRLATKPSKKTEASPALPGVVVAPARPSPKVPKYFGFDDESAEAIKLRSGSGDPVAGKDKSELCQGCHGEDGNNVEANIPKLAGQYAQYIAKQLRNYQSGKRTHAIMSAMASTIDDNDLADIAAYFASQKKMRGNGSAHSQAGENLFVNGDMSRGVIACINCHGVDGKGKTSSNAVFPVIGGQHKNYLLNELTHFRNGKRSNSQGGIMNQITQSLSDAEIAVLAQYVSGL